MPEVSPEDSLSKSKNAIAREKSRSVELGRKEFPTWRLRSNGLTGSYSGPEVLVMYRKRAGATCPGTPSPQSAPPIRH